MPNLLAITHQNACEYLSNPLLHETVIAGTIQTNTLPGSLQHWRTEKTFKTSQDLRTANYIPKHREKPRRIPHTLKIIAINTTATFQR